MPRVGQKLHDRGLEDESVHGVTCTLEAILKVHVCFLLFASLAQLSRLTTDCHAAFNLRNVNLIRAAGLFLISKKFFIETSVL